MKKSNILKFILIELLVLLVSYMVHENQIKERFEGELNTELHWANKVDNEYELNEANPVLEEVFFLNLPDIYRIILCGRSEDVAQNTRARVTLQSADGTRTFYDSDFPVKAGFGKEDELYRLKIEEEIKKDELLLLRISLTDPGTTRLILKANQKTAIVDSFNGNSLDKTNILYRVRYGSVSMLDPLYYILTILLLVTAGVAFILIGVKKFSCEKFFLPVMLLLGLCYQIIIPVGGVPDETWHLDTAYKYSDTILFSGNTGNPGTIYKRKCDAVQMDLLGNDVETGSYYQLLTNTFRAPSDKELVEVAYTDTSAAVPVIVYIPAAIGMAVGRLLGLSPMLMYSLGRYMNLIFFAILLHLAIKMAPYGKNVIALIGLLPITIQQAGSASYDCAITGVTILFTAMVLYYYEGGKASVINVACTAILGIIVILSKNFVYAPMVLLSFVILIKYRNRISNILSRRQKIGTVIGVLLATVAIASAFGDKYISIWNSLNVANRTDANTQVLHYTAVDIITSPGTLFVILWRTFFEQTGDYFRGLFGGILGWYDLNLNFLIPLLFFAFTVLLANSEGDKMYPDKKLRACIIIMCIMSALLVVGGLILGHTEYGATVVEGVQGRYFLPFSGVLLMTATGSIFRVTESDTRRIWNGVFCLETIVILQTVFLAWK